MSLAVSIAGVFLLKSLLINSLDMYMSEILISYDEKKDKFDSYALALKSLLNTLIQNAGIPIHSLDYRVKTRKSLEGKINKKKKYTSIADITDIIGIRIITHYADDVDKIAELVESEFLIDRDNSIDKRITIDPEKFGYLSLHYIASLNETRTPLKEYETYKDIKAEIQIRSILQHAWAEIEHDIGYKSATGLPNDIKRYFSRLAGLLEIADDEFTKIKEKIILRRQEVSIELENGSGNTTLDVVALDEFLNKSKIIHEISLKFEEIYELFLYGKNKNLEYVLKGLELSGLNTIKQLNDALLEKRELIINRISWFGEDFLAYCKKTVEPRELILTYLSQITIALKNSPELEIKYSKETNLELHEDKVSKFFSDIREQINN
ncbi:hypothetical protein OXA74_07980 [Klebsiella pneumoniae]